MKLNYILFVDDIKCPLDFVTSEVMDKYPDGILIAKTPLRAFVIILELGLPGMMYLDHDLGSDGEYNIDIKGFLHELRDHCECEGNTFVPKYICISRNPAGRRWIEDFMSDWVKMAPNFGKDTNFDSNDDQKIFTHGIVAKIVAANMEKIIVL